MATVIPSKLYVTIKHQKEGVGDPTRLGFASPFENNAAFCKRKKSQDEWSYGRGTDFIIREDGGVYHGPNGTKDVAEYFMTNSFPRVLSNESRTGFEIARSVRHSGWRGGGNVLWRIQDPRGFEIEITSENFASMVDCTTIINGVIQEECVWGREGSVNVLLPVNSEPYKDATKQTTLVNNKVSLREVKVGDHVTLIDKSNKSGNRDGVYMGRMFAVTSVRIAIEESQSYNTPIADLTTKVVDLHVFYDTATKIPYAVKRPVIGAIVAKAVDKSTHAENLQKINDLLSQGDTVSEFPSESVIVIAKAADVNDIKIVLEDASIEMNLNDRFKEIKSNTYYHYAELLLLTKDNVTWYASANAKNKNLRTNGYGDKIAALVKIDKDKLINDQQFYISHSINRSTTSGWRDHVTSIEIVPEDIIVNFNPDEYKAKSVWLTHGDLKARLIGMPDGPVNVAQSHY